MHDRALAFMPRQSTVVFRPGQRIMVQGEPAACLYLVRRGVVRLTSTSTQGHEAVLGLVGPGGLFGEQALLGPGHSQPGRPSGWEGSPAVTAVTECEASALRMPAPWNVAEGAPILEALAARLCEALAILERLLHHDVLSRLAGLLAELAERFGVPVPRGIGIRIALPQHDLACMVGASRETVNRSLSALRAMGWVERVGRHLVILDVQALRRFGEEGP